MFASVLIADSQLLFAESLVGALARQPGIEPFREVAVTVGSAVDLARRLRPNVMVVDQWIGTVDGVEATAAIREQAPGVEVLVTSGLPGPAQVQAALSAGAAGFLPRDISVQDLAEAIRRVHGGESPVYIEELWRMVADIDDRAQAAAVVEGRLADLSAREQEVVSLLADGCSPRDLPDVLFLSEGTVRNHLHRILRKTGAASLQELLRLVRRGSPAAPPPIPVNPPWEVMGPANGVTVLVADEQRLFAEALGHSLCDVHDLAVMGVHARSGHDALHGAIRLAPRVFVCDYWMPETSAGALARYLLRWAPGTRVIFLSWLHGREHVADVAWSGAAGLVSKEVSLVQLCNSIRDAAAGRPLTCAQRPPTHLGNFRPPFFGGDELMESLTPRELEVLQLVSRGQSFSEIGEAIGISAGTAKNHFSSVLRKTGSRSRFEALELARRAGYVREPGAPQTLRGRV